jgi:hypothetical protein
VLYRTLTRLFNADPSPSTPTSRQAYLLTAMEAFSNADAARVLDLAPAQFDKRVARTANDWIGNAWFEPRVLIAEAGEGTLLALQLETTLGCELVRARSSETALALTLERSPDVILATGTIRGEFDVAKQVQRHSNAPIVLLTCLAERYLNRVIGGAPVFVVDKPYSLQEVAAIVSQAFWLAPGRGAEPRALRALAS